MQHKKDTKLLNQVERGVEQGEFYASEAETSVSFTSFMAAVVFFFVGLLLTGNPNRRTSLEVPLVFLFISSLGFLYSTIIYANASGELARLHRKSFHSQMTIGNIISEYFGVYFLVFSIPLAIYGYLSNRILGLIVFLIDITGFLAYHCSGYSILERYINKHLFKGVLCTLVAIYTLQFLTLLFKRFPEYYVTSSFLVVYILGISILSLISGGDKKCGGNAKDI